MKTVYKIRNKKTNAFVGAGLWRSKPEKVWDKLSYARNAIAQRCKDNNYLTHNQRDNFEIVEFQLVEVGVVND